MTYEQLDIIADSYIPILFLCTLAFIIKSTIDNGPRSTSASILATFISILAVYSLMFLDVKYQIWSSFNADYSTHTALALVFIVFFGFKNKFVMCTSIFSFISYCILMLYQKYHTFIDIASTSLTLTPLFYWLQAKANNSKFS